MSMIEVMRKALEAMRGAAAELSSILAAINDERMPHDGDEFHERLDACLSVSAALRAEIERLEAAEPVAWAVFWKVGSAMPDGTWWARGRVCDNEAEALEAKEKYTQPARVAPLYTAPAPPAAIPALTLDDMDAAPKNCLYVPSDLAHWAYALAAERTGARIKD